MRLKLAILIAVAAVVGLPAPADARHRSPCSPAASRTLVATKEARVFEKRARHPRTRSVTRRVAYGCLRRVGRAFPLGERVSPGERWTYEFRLAGRFVGYAADDCPAGCASAVLVVDLRTGRRVRRAAPTDLEPTAGGVTDLELARTGSVAWIARSLPNPEPQVRKLDAEGPALLDAGPGVDPASLALSGSTLYWAKAGMPFSAPLR